ncbi:MAG: hypothetical protein AB8H86_17045 [Polyangiales bacterium]
MQQRYAARIKARLGSPKVDAKSARDGILDCFVATYFGGLKQGIGGYLGIDASEEHVARIAQALFRKKLVNYGATFDEPTVDALDRVRTEVDQELHFQALPAELKGVHDQVCSLMLSKAEGTLAHDGKKSAVTGRGSHPPLTIGRMSRPPEAPPATRPTPQPASTVSFGLRSALAAYLEESAAAVREGASDDELAKRLARLERLFATVRDFE